MSCKENYDGNKNHIQSKLKLAKELNEIHTIPISTSMLNNLF